jgi:hypothetical protein
VDNQGTAVSSNSWLLQMWWLQCLQQLPWLLHMGSFLGIHVSCDGV